MELFLNRFELYDLTLYNILRLSSKTEIILNRKRRRRMEIKRDYYLNKLIRKKDNGFIKIITGIRRSGKSYLLNNLFYNYLTQSGADENHIIKFAFDSARDLLKIGENLMDLDLLSGERLVDPKKFLDENGILTINLFDFLLNKESLDL